MHLLSALHWRPQVPTLVPRRVPFPFQQDERNYHESRETRQTASTSEHWWERNCSVKEEVVHRTATENDTKLQFSLKKLRVNEISRIGEVNMFTNQGTVIHFNNPELQASLAVKTFTIIGHADTKQLTEMLPSIFNQLGTDSLTSLRRLGKALPKQSVDEKTPLATGEKDDNQVPNLVENFEEASKNEAN
ncbi:transcription factor BTF3-like [Hyaena hyaena]|uniref:transcription factor BTF3-like n=1 Tax=Hyaena hyaena TaxID=95912 RepID=UPI0019227B2A|nr:transcription factor BTF3-like [Hyaena hyaena]